MENHYQVYGDSDTLVKYYNSHLFNLIKAIVTVFVLFVSPDIEKINLYPTYGMKYALIVLLVWGGYEKTKSIKRVGLKNYLLKSVIVLFAIVNTAGIYMYYKKSFPDTVFGWFMFALRAVVYGMMFNSCLDVLTYYYNHFFEKIDLSFVQIIYGIKAKLEKNNDLKAVIKYISKHKYSFVSTVIFLGWLPWLVIFYPASIEWDTYYPIEQFMGIIEKSNHHPWTYVMVVGQFYKFGVTIGDKNFGMFLYILIRDIICAAIYGAVVMKLYKKGVKKILCFLVMMFYTVTPVFGAYAKHAFKNTLAAALFTLFIMMVFDAVEHLMNDSYSWKDSLRLGSSAFIFCAFLNNGIYVSVPVVFILCFIEIRKRYVKSAILLLTIMMSFFVYHKWGMTHYDIRPSSKAEALAIPMQQVSRTIKYNMENLTAEDREMLSGYGDLQAIADAYDPLVSDPVKTIWINADHGSKEFIKIWAKLLVKHPMRYIEAFIGHSYGYYAFTPREEEHAGNWNCGMTYFHWVKDPRYSPEFTCDYIDGFEGGRQFLEKWADFWDVIPLLSLTDTMPLYTWCIVLFGLLMIQKKRFIMLIPIMASILMILTCMASPVNGCFRYFSSVAASFPMLMVMIPKKNVE